jgi:hypothetical protein
MLESRTSVVKQLIKLQISQFIYVLQMLSYTMGTGYLSGSQSGRGVALATHPIPHLAPRLKKEQSYTSNPPPSGPSLACSRANFNNW